MLSNSSALYIYRLLKLILFFLNPTHKIYFIKFDFPRIEGSMAENLYVFASMGVVAHYLLSFPVTCLNSNDVIKIDIIVKFIDFNFVTLYFFAATTVAGFDRQVEVINTLTRDNIYDHLHFCPSQSWPLQCHKL